MKYLALKSISFAEGKEVKSDQIGKIKAVDDSNADYVLERAETEKKAAAKRAKESDMPFTVSYYVEVKEADKVKQDGKKSKAKTKDVDAEEAAKKAAEEEAAKKAASLKKKSPIVEE